MFTEDQKRRIEAQADGQIRLSIIEYLAGDPAVQIDNALPQPWVNFARDKYGLDVRGHFVWAYIKGDPLGRPIAIDFEGLLMAGKFTLGAM